MLQDAFGLREGEPEATAELRKHCLDVTSLLAGRVNELEVHLAVVMEAMQHMQEDADQ